MHNSHVLLWLRWRIWVAHQQCRPYAETWLSGWHDAELRRAQEYENNERRK